MNEQAMKFRLGVFVLGAAVVLAVLIVLFGEFPAVFTRQIPYSVKFAQAPGVEPGTPVRKSGIRIGEVTALDLNSETGEVTVRVVVDEKHRLRVGDLPSLGRGLVMGDTTINFAPVEGSNREEAENGHVFIGEPVADLSKAIGRAGELVPTTQAALEQIASTAKSIQEFMPQVRKTNEEIQVAARNMGKAAERVDVLVQTNQEKVTRTLDNLNDVAGRAAAILTPENEKAFNATLKSFRSASESFEKLTQNADKLVTNADGKLKTLSEQADLTMKHADAMIADSRKLLKNVAPQVESAAKNFDELVAQLRDLAKNANMRFDSLVTNAEAFLKDGRGTLKQFNETMKKGDEVLGNLQKITTPLAERSASLIKNVEEGVVRFNQFTGDLTEFTKALAEGDGTLRRLVSDPALYNRMNDTAANIDKAVRSLDRIMRNLEVFSDKIARHPELLGAGGVVNPSSGLKDSPIPRSPGLRAPGK